MKQSLKERTGRGRRGADGRAILRPAFRDGWLPFVVHLWTDVALFSAVACAVVVAVLSQDPGAQAAAAPPGPAVAARRMLFAQARATHSLPLLTTHRQVARAASPNRPRRE